MISLKTIQVKCLKNFLNSGKIELSVPDGVNQGSGLNIFVGENGTGKSAILKAINALGENELINKVKVEIEDFNCKSENPITIIGELYEEFSYKMAQPWQKLLEIKELKFVAKKRDRKSPGKLFSYPISSSLICEPTSRVQSWYKDGSVEISDFYLSFDQDRMVEKNFNIFFFDSERNKHSKKGFSTLFSKVLEDFNWRFTNGLDEVKKKEVLDAWMSYYSLVVNPKSGEAVKDLLEKKFNRPDLSHLSIELLRFDEPFKNAFFALAPHTDLSQIDMSNTGSGTELLFTLLFIKVITDQIDSNIIYCIDEPELSLHPQWQKILLDILVEESKTKQIFIATHSLHFISPKLLGNIRRCYVDNNEAKVARFPQEIARKSKVQDMFYLENRELFFAKKVLIVEGMEDRTRISKFLSDESLDMFVMSGLQNIKYVKEVCTSLHIKFKIIVDLDYLRYFPDLIPILSPEELEKVDEIKSLNELLKLCSDEKLNKELQKVKNGLENPSLLKAISSKIVTKKIADPAYKEIIDEKIEELKSQGISVLTQGMIEDYLDENGKPQNNQTKAELISILS